MVIKGLQSSAVAWILFCWFLEKTLFFAFFEEKDIY